MDERRWSLRREAFLVMADGRTPLTERARAATVAQTASVFGNVAAEPWRAALLFRGGTDSAEVLNVAEPHGAQRPALFGLEGSMDAAQAASVFGRVSVEARRAALLCRGGAEVRNVAEPHGTQRPTLFGLEGGMDVGIGDVEVWSWGSL